MKKTGDKILKKDFAGLWIPTHHVHDGEMDDLLSWLLLEFIHQGLGSQLNVLVQMPKDIHFDEVVDWLRGLNEKRATRVKVFRDNDSTNREALRQLHVKDFPKLRDMPKRPSVKLRTQVVVA